MSHRSLFSIFSVYSFLPNKLRHKAILPEYLIAQFFEICLLIIVDGDENDAILCEQVAREGESWEHEGEPGGMAGASPLGHRENAPGTLLVDVETLGKCLGREVELVVIYKAVAARVVRRVDVDHLHFAIIRLHQVLQGIKVVAADIDVLAVAVLGQGVVFVVGADDGRGVHVGQHARVVLAQEGEAGGLVSHLGVAGQRGLEALDVELPVGCEALWEEFVQGLHLPLSGMSRLIGCDDVFYHCCVFVLTAVLCFNLQKYTKISIHQRLKVENVRYLLLSPPYAIP